MNNITDINEFRAKRYFTRVADKIIARERLLASLEIEAVDENFKRKAFIRLNEYKNRKLEREENKHE